MGRQKKSLGLGDTLERITEATGISSSRKSNRNYRMGLWMR